MLVEACSTEHIIHYITIEKGKYNFEWYVNLFYLEVSTEGLDDLLGDLLVDGMYIFWEPDYAFLMRQKVALKGKELII